MENALPCVERIGDIRMAILEHIASPLLGCLSRNNLFAIYFTHLPVNSYGFTII